MAFVIHTYIAMLHIWVEEDNLPCNGHKIDLRSKGLIYVITHTILFKGVSQFEEIQYVDLSNVKQTSPSCKDNRLLSQNQIVQTPPFDYLWFLQCKRNMVTLQ